MPVAHQLGFVAAEQKHSLFDTGHIVVWRFLVYFKKGILVYQV